MMSTESYVFVTLGCPKNQVDSDKLAGTLDAIGMAESKDIASADVIVVNTCAFVEQARQESVETILDVAQQRRSDARLVVTGCLAQRYGDELADALPEIDQVAGFGSDFTSPTRNVHGQANKEQTRIQLGPKKSASNGQVTARVPQFDLLNLPRPQAKRPWAYVKIAEGCDRACGFCAIPSFRGPQRSRTVEQIIAEVESLATKEIVLVAQDIAAYGRDKHYNNASTATITELLASVASKVARVRLLYIYPADLTDELVDGICDTGVPYFDLSLQHVSAKLLRSMRRWGNGDKFLARINAIRAKEPVAVFRSNFIVGYPGETEDDHNELLDFIEQAQLDWCGFFAYSEEVGTYASNLAVKTPPELLWQRLAELTELQDSITATKRDELVGTRVKVLVDEVGVGRSFREAPEIDGVILLPSTHQVGTMPTVTVSASLGADLEAR